MVKDLATPLAILILFKLIILLNLLILLQLLISLKQFQPCGVVAQTHEVLLVHCI